MAGVQDLLVAMLVPIVSILVFPTYASRVCVKEEEAREIETVTADPAVAAGQETEEARGMVSSVIVPLDASILE